VRPRLDTDGFVPRPSMDEAVGVKHHRLIRSIQPARSAFAGFRFPPEVILIAVRWYLRYGLSYRIWRSCFLSGVSRSTT